MDKNGAIIIIEDDLDDQMILEEIFIELAYPNKRIYFNDGLLAIDFLFATKDPLFIIICDINLPKVNGLVIRDLIRTDARLSHRFIPHVYLSTAGNPQAIIEAHDRSPHGYFKKPDGYEDFKQTVRKIVDYWKDCIAPAN